MDKISWQTFEYLHTEKTADWYWIVGIVTISIAIIAIILNNIIFAILIIISTFTLSLFASRRPDIIDVEIDSGKVKLGRVQYTYKDMDSFWVETREFHPKILFKTKKIFSPYVVVYIQDHDPEDVREILLKYLPEEEHHEPLFEKILMYLGF